MRNDEKFVYYSKLLIQWTDEWSDTVSRRGMLADFGERKKRKEIDFEGIEFKKENPSSIEGRKSKDREKIFPPPFVNDFITF